MFIIIQVDKILGIDPAGAIFDYHPSEFRLDKSDASVVHVLHTSGYPGFSGLEDTIADVDFYPNGMWHNQPIDCPNSESFKCGCSEISLFWSNEGKEKMSSILISLLQ